MSKKEESKDKKLNLAEYRSLVKGREAEKSKTSNHTSYSRHDFKPSKEVSGKTLIIMGLLIVSLGINWGIWNVRYSEGSINGYEFGHEDGYVNGFSGGKNSGYSSGYENGYDDGIRDGTVFGYDDGYNIGFNQGNETGHLSGYNCGILDGYDEGHSIGLTQGENAGYVFGYDNGKLEGYEEGYVEGIEDGAGRGFTIRDPTYNEAINFMNIDKTDELKYTDNFVCYHFVATFKQNAFEAGYRCFYVGLDYPGNIGHAIVSFDTTDRGLIFIEPQLDRVVTVKIGESYSELNNFQSTSNDIILDFILIP